MNRRETISPQKLLLKVLITPKTKRDSIYFYFRNSNLEVSPNIVEGERGGYEKLKIIPKLYVCNVSASKIFPTLNMTTSLKNPNILP